MAPLFYPYSCDSNERRHFLLISACLGIGVVYLIHLALDCLHIRLWWFIEMPQIPAATWAIFSIGTHSLWRQNWFRVLFKVKIPDLNGKWTGSLVSSYDDFKTQYPCELIVEQTWTAIGLTFKAAASESFNGITGIAVHTPAGARLVYEYYNTPRTDKANPTMHQHSGTQWLTLSEVADSRILGGDYYTGRDRGTTGRLTLSQPS